MGMPDRVAFQETERYRRVENAPRVEHPFWDRIMARRVEGQMVRDWQLGFVSWNCLFKAAVNLSRSLWSYENIKHEGQDMKVTASQLEEAAIAIVKGLSGTYTNPGDGKKLPVNGDLTKLKYVASLSSVARTILNNAEVTTRKIAGTQETRRQMRFETNALRVKYGVPIFVTFSPDEKHNLLMIRLTRSLFTFIYFQTYIEIYICIYVYIYICIYTYIYIYIHTYIYVNTRSTNEVNQAK